MAAAHRFLALIGLTCLPVLASIPYKHARFYYESRVDLAEPETYRIQKHLSEVEWDLRNHAPAGLSRAMGGTSAKGVYRLDADSLAWLGHPTGTASLSRIRREGANGGRLLPPTSP